MKKLIIIVILALLTSCGSASLNSDYMKFPDETMVLEGRVIHVFLNRRGSVIAFNLYNKQSKTKYKVCNVFKPYSYFNKHRVYKINVVKTYYGRKKRKNSATVLSYQYNYIGLVNAFKVP